MLPRAGLKKKISEKKPNRVSSTSYYRGISTPSSAPKSPFDRRSPSKSIKKQLTKAVDWLLISAIFFCFIYSLIVKPTPRVTANSYAFRPQSAYTDFAAKKTTAIRDRNKITFDESSLVTGLEKQFPEISNAWVELPIFGQKPVVHLTIGVPAFTYNIQNTNYILNSDGVIVGSAASLPSLKNLPSVIDQSNIPAGPGTKVISSDAVDFINQVLAQAKKAKIPITNIVLPPIAQEIQVRTSDQPYYVKFYFGNDVNVQIGQWLAARNEFASKGIKPADYLDVRVAGKVFYK